MSSTALLARLRGTNEWKFAGVLPRADAGLAVAWWSVLVLRGLLPAAFQFTPPPGAEVAIIRR